VSLLCYTDDEKSCGYRPEKCRPATFRKKTTRKEEKDLNSMMSNKTEKKIFYTFIPPRELRYRNAAGTIQKPSRFQTAASCSGTAQG